MSRSARCRSADTIVCGTFETMTRRALLLLSLCLAPACSLVVKSDDLIGGAPAGAGEAGAGVPGLDGAVDGAMVDAGLMDGARGCQGKTLCDDFEGAGTIPWKPAMTGNASVIVDAVKPRGGARSMHASRAPAAGRDAAYYGYSLAGTLRFCELDVFATSTTGDSFSAFNLGFGSVEAPFTSYSISLQMGGSLAQFGAMTGSSPPLYSDVHVASLAFGAWKHVRIEFDWASSSPAVLLSVDGAAEPRFPISPPKGTQPFVEIGMTYEAAQGAGWEVFVDNVVCATD